MTLDTDGKLEQIFKDTELVPSTWWNSQTEESLVKAGFFLSLCTLTYIMLCVEMSCILSVKATNLVSRQ